MAGTGLPAFSGFASSFSASLFLPSSAGAPALGAVTANSPGASGPLPSRTVPAPAAFVRSGPSSLFPASTRKGTDTSSAPTTAAPASAAFPGRPTGPASCCGFPIAVAVMVRTRAGSRLWAAAAEASGSVSESEAPEEEASGVAAGASGAGARASGRPPCPVFSPSGAFSASDILSVSAAPASMASASAASVFACTGAGAEAGVCGDDERVTGSSLWCGAGARSCRVRRSGPPDRN
ncbi:hypothetical protein SBADM41S_09781 [Streptomyces badius]